MSSAPLVLKNFCPVVLYSEYMDLVLGVQVKQVDLNEREQNQRK